MMQRHDKGTTQRASIEAGDDPGPRQAHPLSGVRSRRAQAADIARGGAAAVFGADGELADKPGGAVKRGGAGRKRRIGNIRGGAFVAEAGAQTSAASGRVDGAVASTGGRGDRTSQVDSDTSVRMQDETDAQAEQIVAAVARAQTLLSGVLASLGACSPQTEAALDRHFQTHDAEAVTHIRGVYTTVQGAFAGTIPIEVESEGDDANAYVYVINSDIHLCPPWFGYGVVRRAAILVHEMTHKYAGTDDHAYIHDADAYNNLDPKDACDNADSYEEFMLDVAGLSNSW